MGTFGNQPFGLVDIKLTTLAGVQVDLPAAQTMKVTPRLRSGELSGDDSLVAVAAYIEAAEWELSAGGISLEAYAVLAGKTLVTSGTTPSQYSTLNFAAGQRLPYIKIYGKALGVGLDDIHCKLYKAKVMKLEGEFKEGEFLITKCSGIAVDDGTANGIWDWVQHETAAALPIT